MHIGYQRPEKSYSKGDSEAGFLKCISPCILIQILSHKIQKPMLAKHEIIDSRDVG